MKKDFIEELKKQEKDAIVGVMAFMSYNPSIGRVLEKGGVKKFQGMMPHKVKELNKVKSEKTFDDFHKKWISEFIQNIKTNSGGQCSYGQAQKAINVFLKVFVDWAGLPDRKTRERILPFLHVPLDSILMKEVLKEFPEIKNTNKGIKAGSLSKIDQNAYYSWQRFFRKEHPEKPLLFDIIWAKNR